MLKRVIPLVIVGFLVIAFSVAPALALLSVGQTAPDFTLPNLSGSSHTLSDYRGKVVVFDFFEPYCGYCQQDTRENLIPLYNTYYKNNANVQFFSIETSGASVSTIQSVYLGATGTIPWPILRNGGNVASAYGVGVTPTVYVIGPTGNVELAMDYNSPINTATLKSTIDNNLPKTKTATTTTITASPTNPAIGSAVTLSVTVKAGTTILTNKQVTVTHTYPGGTTPGKDGVFDTGSGTATFSATYGSAGQRVYTAAFAGDTQYTSSSGTATVNVAGGHP